MTNPSLPRDVAEIARAARFFKRAATAVLVLVALAALTFGAIKLEQHRDTRHASWVRCMEHPFSDPDAITANIAECDRLYK